MKAIATITIILIFTLIGYGQTKFEREYSIREGEVPAPALELVSNLPLNKVKWFAEESQDGKTVEAKFKFRREQHSVEFDSLGTLLDAEIVIPCDRIPEKTQRAFLFELDQMFDHYKIRKIQKQYITETADMMVVLLQGDESIPHEKNYEMIIKGSKDGEVKLFEITFDHSGRLLDKKAITFSTSDHLEY